MRREQETLSRRFTTLLSKILSQMPEQAPSQADLRSLDRTRTAPDRPPGRAVLAKNPHITRAQLARKLGIEDESLARKLRDGGSFTLDQIHIILSVVNDPRLVRLVLDGTGYRAAEAPPLRERDDPPESILQAAMHIIFHASSLAMEMERAVRDGKITSDERDRIMHELGDAETALSSLRLMLSDSRLIPY